MMSLSSIHKIYICCTSKGRALGLSDSARDSEYARNQFYTDPFYVLITSPSVRRRSTAYLQSTPSKYIPLLVAQHPAL